ncbi:MAG: YgjP-like metallopeptidase domain-containing protein [Mucinivorans sp.]
MGLINRILGREKPLRTTIRFKIANPIIMGRKYKIEAHVTGRNSFKIEDGVIIFTLKDSTKANFQNYYTTWYKRLARKEFLKAVELWLPSFESLGYEIPKPRIKIFKMHRAWGRCYYTKGLITLNLNLLMLPQECIEYIALHELSHFVAHDHGPLFKATLTKIDPQWTSKKMLIRELEPKLVLMR